MTTFSPVMRLVYRRGERVWFRNISRDVDYATGLPREAYLDNQSTTMRIVETIRTEYGVNMALPVGKAIGYCDPADYWNDSVTVKINDIIIRLPDNYSDGTSVIYRVDDVKRVNRFNQSQMYIRVDLTETEARE